MSTRKLESVLCVDDDSDICEIVTTTLSLIAGLNVGDLDGFLKIF
jgi:hypothetical protein